MNRSWLNIACTGVFFVVFFPGAQAQSSSGHSDKPDRTSRPDRPNPFHGPDHPDRINPPNRPDRPDYWSIDLNAAQFSLADVHRTDAGTTSLSIPRFTWMVNLAAHYHYDLNENFGFYTGAAVTNLGVIIKSGGVKYKRRIYTLGIPLAFKLGSLKYAHFFGGVQVDWALQYQEKHKVGDSVQSKFGEWGSNRTPRVLGSWFIGGTLLHTCYFKLQSYFTNFFNRNYTDGAGAQPYSNLIARPFLLTFGFDIITGKKYSFMTRKSPKKPLP